MNGLLAAALLLGGWGTSCAAVAAPEWVEAYPGWLYRLERGQPVEAVDSESGVRYDRKGGKWVERKPVKCGKDGCICQVCPCPDGAPCDEGCKCGRSVSTVHGLSTQNFGFELSRRGGNRYEVNGHEVGKAEVIAAIEGSVPDDAGRMKLTAIGPKDLTAKVLADVASSPAFTDLKGKLSVKAYEPTNWAVARYGFKTDGKPTVYLQAPDGKVLHRQDDYEGGADRLARAVRKADPTYDQKKDPDLSKPSLPKLDMSWLPILALLLSLLWPVNR